MKKYLICILQSRNSSFTLATVFHLIKALKEKPEYIKECQIVIVSSANGDAELIKLKSIYGDIYNIDIIDNIKSYLAKMDIIFSRYSLQDFEYFIKHDDDILISSNSWKKLLELSPSILDKESNLLTTIALSTGIPTWSYFASDFIDIKLQKDIYDRLINCRVPNQLWGNDYSHVNEGILKMEQWDENIYWGYINQGVYDYKGLHPIRVNLQLNKIINQEIIKNYNLFQSKDVGEGFISINDRYFCNNFFVIKYKNYQRIIKDKSLYIDDFDEVPINRYMKKNNLNMCILKGSLGVHIMYNSTYNQEAKYNNRNYSGFFLEEKFCEEYFNLIKNILGHDDKKIHSFSFNRTPVLRKMSLVFFSNNFYKNIRKKLAGNQKIKNLYVIIKSRIMPNARV